MNEHDTETTERPAQPTGARHPVHVAHLVMGLAFLGIAAVWLVVRMVDLPADDVRFLLPLPFLFAGGLGLLALVLAAWGKRSSRLRPQPLRWRG